MGGRVGRSADGRQPHLARITDGGGRTPRPEPLGSGRDALLPLAPAGKPPACLVGARGFEPPTPRSPEPSARYQAALRPVPPRGTPAAGCPYDGPRLPRQPPRPLPDSAPTIMHPLDDASRFPPLTRPLTVECSYLLLIPDILRLRPLPAFTRRSLRVKHSCNRAARNPTCGRISPPSRWKSRRSLPWEDPSSPKAPLHPTSTTPETTTAV